MPALDLRTREQLKHPTLPARIADSAPDRQRCLETFQRLARLVRLDRDLAEQRQRVPLQRRLLGTTVNRQRFAQMAACLL